MVVMSEADNHRYIPRCPWQRPNALATAAVLTVARLNCIVQLLVIWQFFLTIFCKKIRICISGFEKQKLLQFLRKEIPNVIDDTTWRALQNYFEQFLKMLRESPSLAISFFSLPAVGCSKTTQKYFVFWNATAQFWNCMSCWLGRKREGEMHNQQS